MFSHEFQCFYIIIKLLSRTQQKCSRSKLNTIKSKSLHNFKCFHTDVTVCTYIPMFNASFNAFQWFSIFFLHSFHWFWMITVFLHDLPLQEVTFIECSLTLLRHLAAEFWTCIKIIKIFVYNRFHNKNAFITTKH